MAGPGKHLCNWYNSSVGFVVWWSFSSLVEHSSAAPRWAQEGGARLECKAWLTKAVLPRFRPMRVSLAYCFWRPGGGWNHRSHCSQPGGRFWGGVSAGRVLGRKDLGSGSGENQRRKKRQVGALFRGCGALAAGCVSGWKARSLAGIMGSGQRGIARPKHLVRQSPTVRPPQAPTQRFPFGALRAFSGRFAAPCEAC
jgi:hypothetical protein